MTESTEVDERVDIDEDNYMEELDNEVEDQPAEEREDDDEDSPSQENSEEDSEVSKAAAGEEDHTMESDRIGANTEPLKEEEKLDFSVTKEEREKHAHLLSLPPHGSEVFIGGLPKDVSEDDLWDLCQPMGEIFEVRLMKDKDTGQSKGFAFVSFTSKEAAQKAIEDLHSKELRGRTLRCSLSETKNRLFVGNVPKSWTEDEFRKVIEAVGPGVEIIELIKDPQNPSRNRGFAFVLYYNNACADYSRQKMLDSNFKLEESTPTVSWADPKGTPENSAAAAQVKALYVKNIPKNTSTEQLKELFQRHGEVTKVVMPPGKAGKRDFGFIHYAERSSALKAVKENEKYEIDGQSLEVVLAKPQADKKSAYGGFAGNPYGSLGGGFGVPGSFQQPVVYGRGTMPAGMQMVPMVLPDGQIGYVLQQQGVQMPHHRARRGDQSSDTSVLGRAGSSGDGGNRGKRYRPY